VEAEIMPFYEYKCKDCERRFEEFQKISDDPIIKCSKCDGIVIKLISIGMCEVKYDAREFYEKVIKPDAKEIADKIRDGDENAAADIFGEPSR
jgi:putative FmdB family regulatory protein